MKNYKALLFFLFLSVSGFAENKKDKVVDVSVKNQSIRILFSQIEAQLDLKFSYNTQLINADSSITYHGMKSVKKVILEVFDKQVRAKIVGNYIVLLAGKKAVRASEKANPNTIEFTGIILDSQTDKPLADVSIYEISSRQTVLSNSLGKFKMVLEKGDSKNFNIAKSNFSDTIVSVNILENNALSIPLTPINTPITIPSKPTKTALLNDTNFVEKMVPLDAQIASENLMEINDIVLWQVSAIPSIGTNRKASGIVTNHLSFNFLGGYNGGVYGAEIGGLFNILTKDMFGFQAAGLTNQIMGKTEGFQVAGIFNRCEKQVTGFQVSGISNFLHDSVTGLQVAGISNIVNGTVNGLQVSGIHNHTLGRINGIQVAGIVNWGKDSLIGLQVAGISNNLAGTVMGLQVSGIHNRATKTVYGGQISAIRNNTESKLYGVQIGLTNYAKVNNGFQLGLVNFADSANGIAVGLFNYVKDGYHPLEAFGNEVLYANLAFKSGVNAFYTMWTAGFRPSNPEVFGFGIGLGSRINTWKWLSVSFDLTSTMINESKITSEYQFELNLLNRADITIDFNIWKLNLFAGPGINLHISQLGFEKTGAFTSNIARDPFYTGMEGQTQFQSWVGGKAGIRYNF